MATATEAPPSPTMPVVTPELPSGMRMSNDEQRIVLRGVSWETYLRLVEETGDDRHALMAFNRGVLEIMSPGPTHEHEKRRLDGLVEILSEEVGIPIAGYGSTTWKNPAAERGVEPDECCYFARDKIAAARVLKRRRCNDAEQYPAPDLAIEIDIRRSAVNRAEIYASLGVPEVWRFDGLRLAIDALGDDGAYRPAEASRFLPIRPEDVVRWVTEDAEDDGVWRRRFRQWVRERVAGLPGR